MLIITIWPLFALICLGFGLYRAGFPERAFWPAAERINYFVLFPALLISSLAKAPIHDPAVLRLGAAAVVTVLAAAAGLALWRVLRPMPAARFGPALQGAVRFNTYLGLAVTLSLAGAEGMARAAVLLAVLVPLVNVLSIVALSEAQVLRNPVRLVAEMARNPLILACVAGIALSLTGLGLPWGLDEFAGLLARASLPLGLLCVGAALQPASLRSEGLALAALTGLRLVAMPALAAALAVLFGLGRVEAQVLVIFTAIPTATAAYVLTRQLGGDGQFMAALITAQTLASVVTIPLMLAALGFA